MNLSHRLLSKQPFVPPARILRWPFILAGMVAQFIALALLPDLTPQDKVANLAYALCVISFYGLYLFGNSFYPVNRRNVRIAGRRLARAFQNGRKDILALGLGLSREELVQSLPDTGQATFHIQVSRTDLPRRPVN